MSVFEFEGHILDLRQGRLRNSAGDVTLRPKSLALLTYFVQNPGRVIAKDELVQAVWPDTFVSDDSLSQCLKDIRAALGPGAEGFIRTVPRRGYVLDEARLSTQALGQSEARSSPTPRERTSLAVLPFSNISGDPAQEFFADGVTTDIITDLSKASGLSVIARSSMFLYKGRPAEVAEIASRFGVSHVLEGSVRRSGRRVRINAQLTDAANGTNIWAERYDRDLSDIFSVQDDIAHSIVDALKVRLLPQESAAIRKTCTNISAAYDFYLRGRHYLNLHSLRGYDSAYRMFMKAVDLDPRYAHAYAGASDCCAFRCMWNADVSLNQTLDLSAEALRSDPELPEAHAARGWALSVAARYDEAGRHFDEAIRRDPMSYEAHYLYARSYALQGRYAQAAHFFELAIKVAPEDFQAYGNLSHQLWALGKRDDAMTAERGCLERAERELEVRPDNQRALCYGALSLTILGDAGRAQEWAERALWLDSDDSQVLYNVASVFSLMGNQAKAIELLERCLPGKHPQMLTWARHDQDFASLHNNPRFLALVEQERK